MKKLNTFSILLLILIPILLPITSQTPPKQSTEQLQHTEQSQIQEHRTALTKVWEKRKDLQRLFPNKINGQHEMKDWTLTQWAEEFGWKEYHSLKKYNEQAEKDYIYNKYLPLERAINKIASREYILDEYDCKHFSLDLKAELEKENISSTMITGFNNIKGHRWLAIEIDPIFGEFIGINKFNNEFPYQLLTKNYLNE